MPSDDHLGQALRESLRKLVDGIEPSDHLIERVDAIGRRPPSGRTRRIRALALASSVAVVVIAAIVFAVTGSRPTPSYAVTLESDHSVKVTIYQLTGVQGATTRLRALGVRAVVVPVTATCTSKVALSYIGISERPAPTIRLIPNDIPAGTTVVLAAKQTTKNNVQMAIGRVTGTPPTCVAPGTNGPGVGGGGSP